MAEWIQLGGYPRELGGTLKYAGVRGKDVGDKVELIKGLAALVDLFERLVFDAAQRLDVRGEGAAARAIDAALEGTVGSTRLRLHLDVLHFVRVRETELDLAFTATQLKGEGRLHMDLAGPVRKFAGRPPPPGAPDFPRARPSGPTLKQRFAAAEAGEIAVVRAVDRGALDHDDSFGRTLLTVACQNDHAAIVAALLDAGAGPTAHREEALFLRYLPEEARDVERGDGHTLLHIAAWSHSLSVVELLLARGFSVDARDRYGGTPLIDAALRDSHGAGAVIHSLLAAGAAVDAHDAVGKTALDHAREIATLSILLDAGASANGGPILGQANAKESSLPSLERFAFEGNLPAVELLLARGADVQRAPHALAAATLGRSMEVAEALLARGPSRASLDEALLAAPDRAWMERLLDAGAGDLDGALAKATDSPEIAAWLIERGARAQKSDPSRAPGDAPPEPAPKPLVAASPPVLPPKHAVAAEGGFDVGDAVEHARFGRGSVVDVEGSGPTARVTVDVGGKERTLPASSLRTVPSG